MNYFSPIDQCYNKHFDQIFIGNLRTCARTNIIVIDSRTWCARIDIFQSTKIVTQSKSFQRDNLNFTVQNIAFLYNKMSINFRLILFFLMSVLLKINFDILWSVIAKCIKDPLMSTDFACENVFTKQLIKLSNTLWRC